MIEATIILGEEAVARYNETNELPSGEWLTDNGGVVLRIDFRTEAEYDAYVRALSDSDGWNDYQVSNTGRRRRTARSATSGANTSRTRKTLSTARTAGSRSLIFNSIQAMLRIEKISKEIIADLCRSDVRPDGWLPHTVYVEEVGEDEKLGDMPFISFLMRDFA